MTEGTLSNDTIITDIVDCDISIALEKLSIVSDKSSLMMSLIKNPKIYPMTP